MLEPAPGAELSQCCHCLKLVPDQDPDSVTIRLSPRLLSAVKIKRSLVSPAKLSV